ncbi:MAG: ribonuclease G [Halioglobus sp.]|jgi:ribonuclease G
MSEEILINVTAMETRVAVVENGLLQDLHIERIANPGIVGNIYSGKVVRVLPGMQSAFVDIGAQRTAFIHVSDIMPLDSEGREDREHQSEVIGDFLHDGKKIVVQVTKDPLGSKGARLSTAVSISSRYLVLMPQSDYIGVSQRINDEAERDRLQQMLREALAAEDMSEQRGFIIRTAAEGAAQEEIRADLRYLKRVWDAVQRRGKAADRPTVLYEDLALNVRAIRDLARSGLDRILIDDQDCYERLQTFCSDYVPEVSPMLSYYDGERPLFDNHGLEDEIERALSRKVDLKSGGYLIIDQTEAMTTIDVNTGSFVGKKNLEETIFKTNLEAAAMLARQLRVRNLGGIIIIDFIDMRNVQHRRQVHRALEKAMLSDPSRNKITGISELGLVEMTRKRDRESLEHMLCEECAVCSGRGVVKSAETLCFEIFRKIMRDAKAYKNGSLMVLAGQGVVDRLLDEESAIVADLQEMLGKTISFRVEPSYNQEHFDIVLL